MQVITQLTTNGYDLSSYTKEQVTFLTALVKMSYLDGDYTTRQKYILSGHQNNN